MLSNNTQSGVTLIELIVGMVILSILFALAAPSYRGWIQNQQIRTAAESILNGAQLARAAAVNNNSQASFVFCGWPSSSWEVLAASSTAPAPTLSLACGAGSTAAAGFVRVQERSGQEGSRLAQVAVTSVSPQPTLSPITDDGTRTITFNSLGRIVGGLPTTIEVTTPTGDRPLWVTIRGGGNTRLCDPSPLLAATDPRHC
jgi:type IV fimbrial biogenesis protein FimT